VVVKQVQSASRVLATFEALAQHQPAGVSALARALGDDKSAVQRALLTLADAGWIARTGPDLGQWKLTPRVAAFAAVAEQRVNLRAIARPVLEDLRDELGETMLLAVLRDRRVLTIDVVESNQLVRTAPSVGLEIPLEGSAASQAILAHLPATELARVLGGPPSRTLLSHLGRARRRGWAVNNQRVRAGASAIGAAVLDRRGRPLASVTLSGPAARLPPAVLAAHGPRVASAAGRISAMV
jgi:IclR family acetate operon transcriptional repressor